MTMSDPNDVFEFDDLIKNLADLDQPIKAAAVYRLSDMTSNDVAELQDDWKTIPVERRQTITSRISELSEISPEYDFSRFAMMVIDDEDPEVRVHGIHTLGESDLPQARSRLLLLLDLDDNADVRAAAAQGLGRYVLAGELGDLDADITERIEESLIQIWETLEEPFEVRRRALESLAYSGREEVLGFIEEAYTDTALKMQASALFAMGRSADQRWKRTVLDTLRHSEPELRYEAARAAGALMLEEALPNLIDLTNESDFEIRDAAIWSLGEIGGKTARNALLKLLESDPDPDLALSIEDALDMAALNAGEFTAFLLDTQSEDDDIDEVDAWDDLR